MKSSLQKHQTTPMSGVARPDAGSENGEAKAIEDSLERVRDILFGDQIRENENKRNQLEQQFGRQTETLRAETSERLSALTQELKKVRRELRDELKSEARERERDIARLEKGLEKIAQTVLAHDAQNREAQAKLQSQIASETQQLQAQMSMRHDEVMARIDALMATLDDSKVGREPLARFLSELASRLESSPNSKA